MTALRKRFMEDLQLHGFAPSTQYVYVSAIKQLARHYQQPPDQLTEEQLRQYFLHLTQVRKVSRSNATIALCALKFFFEHTLQRSWPVLALARPPRSHHVAQCDHCGHQHYAYHSCRNRHCPKCHTAQTQAWLAQQQSRLLPCPHYLLTFTLPAQLRPLAWAHQKLVYSALLRCAAAAVQTLTRDPRWLGATPVILAILHTWTRTLLYHPHVHLLVSAGGLTSGGQHWLKPKHPAFLVPVRALSVIFRAKFKAVLAQARLLPGVSKTLWQQSWVVHALHAGRGDKALGYLARYVLRVALANSRLEAFHDGQVTFRYRDNRTQQLCRVTLAAEEFLRRFLLHILPAGFPKIRYYGLASASAHPNYQRAQALLQTTQSDSQPAPPTLLTAPNFPIVQLGPRCPKCHAGHLFIVQTLRPRRKFPP